RRRSAGPGRRELPPSVGAAVGEACSARQRARTRRTIAVRASGASNTRAMWRGNSRPITPWSQEAIRRMVSRGARPRRATRLDGRGVFGERSIARRTRARAAVGHHESRAAMGGESEHEQWRCHRPQASTVVSLASMNVPSRAPRLIVTFGQATGRTNPQGTAGPTGPRGAVGSTGPTGAPGGTGRTGLQGAPGATGAGGIGPTGPSGATGVTVATGATVARGDVTPLPTRSH